MTELEEAFGKFGPEWARLSKFICAAGPKRVGPNLLLNGLSIIPNEANTSVPDLLHWAPLSNPSAQTTVDVWRSLLAGFDMACASGPLCEEPTIGVCYIISRVQDLGEGAEAVGRDYGPLAGQVMSTFKEACRSAFNRHPGRRLVQAMYHAHLECTAMTLGALYSVMGRRRGRILDEEMQEGTDRFIITALLPVSESFGFTEEMRTNTSGLARPHLEMSHWEVLNVDPFWTPKTEEELEDFGKDGVVIHNVARDLINAVRKRKGLFVDKKIVEHGEKQRTLQRKK
eukprot:c18917_g1_i1.p1 GENE.c18917_g1_i1~~c18917_g1_i1.p1  ORF type:complete len:311 (+),score=71.16 c18917_g1_i1:81-935(+)